MRIVAMRDHWKCENPELYRRQDGFVIRYSMLLRNKSWAAFHSTGYPVRSAGQRSQRARHFFTPESAMAIMDREYPMAKGKSA